jgi:hypothetical protein
MIRTLFAAFAIVPIVAFGAPENVISAFGAEMQRLGSPEKELPVSVTARAQARDGQYVLSFRLTNISRQPLLISDHNLPWGNANSIILAAQTIDGRRIQNGYPIDDSFVTTDVTIQPGETLEGDYRLRDRLTVVPRDRDVLIMWAYPFIERNSDRPWPVASGVALLPRAQK